MSIHEIILETNKLADKAFKNDVTQACLDALTSAIDNLEIAHNLLHEECDFPLP